MTSPDFDALLARLAAGEPLSAVVQAVRGDGERELLKRCSAVHELDEELFQVLRALPPTVDGPGLQALVASGALEPVPGRDGCYRVPAGERPDHYNRWWTEDGGALVPMALRELSAHVLSYYRARPGSEVEAVYHELLVNRDAALDQFDELYRAADAAFELSRCEDLVDVLTERLALLDVEAAVRANRYRRRLRARTMWMTDWYRTSRFLAPQGSEAAIDALLRGDHGRVLVLWGAGGMGKSSHLRWLIARRCVPQDDACARVDFDEIDPLLATGDPSAVLLEAAHQLDEQLPEAPFHELLVQYAGNRERLHGRAVAERTGGDDVAERFTAVVRDLPVDRRVVLALDTLETALLVGGLKREQTAVAPLLRQLSAIVAEAPALRLVIASRYALSERTSEFGTLFPDAVELYIPGFTEAESRRYLRDFRGIDRPEAIATLARTAGGNPFKLELLADYAEEHPELDAAALAADAQVDLRYVMNRIVERLDPELEKLVRYGVAPRLLERRYVREVLEPLLGEPGLDELWPRLTRYAGTASWITLEPGDLDAVRFHEAVLDPMRELLPDADEVHRRSAEWFERRADDDPTAGTRWLCEAVYHHFQYEGAAAEAFWAGQIKQAGIDQRPDRRRALAAEVLRDDYARDGRERIRPAAVLRARWELAVAAVQLAHEDTPERREAEWLEAERALADLHHLLADFPDAPLSVAEMALLEAGVRLGRRDLADAGPYVDVALADGLSQTDRLWLSLARAECARDGDSVERFQAALAIAEDGPRPRADIALVLMRMARHEAERNHFAEAIAACEQAAGAVEGRAALELALLRAELEWRSGAPSRALEQLTGGACDEPELEARKDILRIRAELAAGRPDAALERAEAASARFSGVLQLGSARQRAVAAEGRELRGKVRAAQLDVNGAIEDFEEADSRWGALGSAEAVCRCRVRGAELYLRGARDINKAEVQLDQARRSPVRRGEDAWTRRTLLGAELLAHKGRVERAEALVDAAIGELQQRAGASRALIDAAQRGLAIARDEAQARHLELLCDQLADVTPATARLALLQPLERCRVLTGPSELRGRLRALVPSPRSHPDLYAHLGPGDLVLLSLRDADVERVARHADTARRIVRDAWTAIAPGAPASIRGEVLKAACRAGDRPLIAELAAALGDEDEPEGPLRASLLLQAAEAMGPGDERARLLRAAWRHLEKQEAAATGWLAAALELEAGEAERTGDVERARNERQRAAQHYEALGDARHARALMSPGEPARPGRLAAELDSLLENEARVTVRLRPREVTISVRQLGRPRNVLRLTRDPPIVRALVELSTDGVGRAAAGAMLRRLVDAPGALGRELAELLLAGLGQGAERAAGGPAFDIGIRSRDTVIRALPWELAAPALPGTFLYRRAPRTRGLPADTRALQATLSRLGSPLSVDGIVGERTRAAIRDFQREHDLRPSGTPDPLTAQRLQAAATGRAAPWVAVVRPTQSVETAAYRGARQSGVPVDWHYELAGFRVMVLEGPSAYEVKRALAQRPVAILHLNVGLVDHHGTPAIDLLPGSPGRRPAGGRLTGTALDALLPTHTLSPLMILEATAPPSRRELATQLLLRNAFAAELAAVGTVRSVLATGLRHYGQQKRLTDALVGVLRRGGDLRELYAAAHAAGGDDDTLPPALFTRTPDLRYPAPC